MARRWGWGKGNWDGMRYDADERLFVLESCLLMAEILESKWEGKKQQRRTATATETDGERTKCLLAYKSKKYL